MRGFSHLMAGCCVALAFTGPARACDLALVLAVDVSGSVNAQEYELQMTGLAQALVDPAVSEALVRGRSAVMLMQWSGGGRQQISVPWRRMNGLGDIEAFSDKVAATPRLWRNFSTAIGEALGVALEALEDVPDCERHVIDVSGDGVSNEGIPPQQMRPLLEAAGVTVNGLAIESDLSVLADYYRNSMIWGPGAFAMRAATYDDYPRRIQQKLLREITKQVASLCPEQVTC